jgi:hypothetical protein
MGVAKKGAVADAAIITSLLNYNKTSFLVQIKFITEDSK